MFQYHYLNKISPKGTALWTENYQKTEDIAQAEAILVRSAAMHDMSFSSNLLAIGRAGAGVNNIPLDRCAQEGIVVFNTPGANANGVVEMAICGMLLGSRDVVGGINWVQTIKDTPDVGKQVEKGKSQFAGCEIKGKSLGVIGLGAIGGPLANAARKLGMTVYGCDPFISIGAAWQLDRQIIHAKTRDEIYANCDIITLHVPLLDDTKKMINREAIAKMKDGVVILNFARDLLVDDDAMEEALKSGKVRRYITDFPNDRTAGMEGVIAIPHLGASTPESEDNCAMMAVDQIADYLENGSIVNSVNYPAVTLTTNEKHRITIMHKNISGIVSKITSAFANEEVNIDNMVNKSRGEYAYTVIDSDTKASPESLEALKKINGIIRIRVIK